MPIFSSSSSPEGAPQTQPDRADIKPPLTLSPDKLNPAEPPRSLLIEALRAGHTISLANDDLGSNAAVAMGDLFIHTWSLKIVLEHLGRSQGIFTSPRISYYPFDPENDVFYLTDHFGKNKLEVNSHQPLPHRVVSDELSDWATLLGVTLPQSVYLQKPQPFAFDHPLVNSWHQETTRITYPRVERKWVRTEKVNQTTIEQEVALLREKLRGRKLIVINMAGSTSWKRFSMRQVQILTIFLRKKYPDAFIAVLTDVKKASPSIFRKAYHGLVSDSPEDQFFETEKREYDPVLFRGPTAETHLENHLLTVRSAQTNPYLSPDVETISLPADEFVMVDTLNQLAAYGEVASLVVTSDTFWSWWHAQAEKLVVLYTVAKPYWEVPGCIPVYSRAIRAAIKNDGDFDPAETMLSTDSYRSFFDRTTTQTSHLGINTRDILALLRKMKELPSGL